MIERIVDFALRFPGVIVLLTLGLVVAGTVSYSFLNIEAYPNPVPPLVEVIAQPEGRSGEEVERYTTIPVEVSLSGMPGLDHIRSQSLFGLSDVKCYFRWGTRYEDARQEVINRISFLQLPGGVQAEISPWNGVGEVFRYFLKGEGYSLMDLKTAQDWILEREFKRVPGVIDVVSFGGLTKQYHVAVDPYRLRAYGVNLAQLQSAIANANQNVGGQRLTIGEQSYDVRGLGLIGSLKDVATIVVAVQKSVPIRVGDLGEVAIGYKPRLGIVGHDELPDAVEGIVLMRYGGETSPTLKGIKERVHHIRELRLLPPGMSLEPYYDRGDLVAATTHTVLENLLLGMGLVIIVLLAFLGHLRAGLIAAVNIPLALLAAFCGVVATGTSANLISLGAVDFGIIIDSTVIMIENIVRHLGKHSVGTLRVRVSAAAAEVGTPMAFSTLIMGVAFLPLFTMTGVSGVIFSPLAHTYAFAIGGAIFMALTLTPVLARRFLRVHEEETENRFIQLLQRLYGPLFRFGLKTSRLGLLYVLGPLGLCVLLLHVIGREFMPKLEEGNLWVRATLPNSVALEVSSRSVGTMRSIVRKYPEVTTVVSQLGRPDDGTDVSGFFNIELFAPLKPSGEWRAGWTKERIIESVSRDLQEAFPGIVFGFSQMISDNVEEALSGVKGENSVKIVGPDLRVNQRIAESVAGVMGGVRGVKDLGLFSSLGQPSVKIIPDRALCTRYGLNTGDVEAVVQAAIGGQVATQVFEGERHFDLVIRWKEPFRRDVEAIRRITVSAPDGTLIPLAQIASITEEDGPSVIYREDGRRNTPVKFSVRGRDLDGVIREAQREIGERVTIPPDTHLEWAGEINELEEARGRLGVVIPVTLAVITFLAYSSVRSAALTAVVLANIPIACAGGLLALLLSGINNSVSAAMGFVSVFGIAIQDAILVVTYAQREWESGKGAAEGVLNASQHRLRAVLMTTLVAMFGLLPAALSNRLGAQTQKPLAVVVIGGALALAVVSRALQPALLLAAHRFLPRVGGDEGAAPPLRRATDYHHEMHPEHDHRRGGPGTRPPHEGGSRP
jgi:cobalt-zinc-cadmium resistance protein CzcA